MRNFKRIFYPLYLGVLILILFIFLYTSEILAFFQEWGFWENEQTLPVIGGPMIIFLSVLMGIAFITENLHISKLKGERRKFEVELNLLKAKLYDQVGKQDAAAAQTNQQIIKDETEW
jgi:uncharacterized membrane protein